MKKYHVIILTTLGIFLAFLSYVLLDTKRAPSSEKKDPGATISPEPTIQVPVPSKTHNNFTPILPKQE